MVLENLFYFVGLLALVVGLGAFFGAPYVPSKRKDVRRLFTKYYSLKESDLVVDLGCGDGVVLAEVDKNGAKALGLEINPVFYVIARLRFINKLNVNVRLVNAWNVPFPDETTVVYIFSVNKDAKRLERKMQKEANRLKKPLNLLCYGNPLPGRQPQGRFEAYSQYRFVPLQP